MCARNEEERVVMARNWTLRLPSRKGIIFLMTCGIVLYLDVCYHYTSRVYMHIGFAKEVDEMSTTTLSDMQGGMWHKPAATIFLSASSHSPLQGTLPISSRRLHFENEVIPGLYSMDQALNLPPGPNISSLENQKTLLVYSQRRDYSLIISHNDTCRPVKSPSSQNFTSKMTTMQDISNEIFLLVVLKSKCASIKRRDAIRASWGNDTWCLRQFGVRIKVLFLLGACENLKVQGSVFDEDHDNSDILQWDFFDSFRNLTLKECLYLQWFATHCLNVPFIFKGDDDILVNMKNIVEFLRSLPSYRIKDLFVGSKLEGSPRILDSRSKYFVSSNLFSGKMYPPYLSGGGFLLSGNLAKRFFIVSLKTRIIPIDDAFLGILAKSLGVKPTNDWTFKSWGMEYTDPCRLAKIKTFHRVLPEDMLQMWNNLISVNLTECSDDSNDVLSRNN